MSERPKCISYSLFGYGKEKEENSFPFVSYLRGLFINFRMNRLLYPGWVSVVHIDEPTYESFKTLWDALPSDSVKIKVMPSAPLCEAMLWRLMPIFERDVLQRPIYDHVICRDLDSPATYREAQAVKYWIDRDKAAHCITDSESHTLPMLGGMIGFVPKYFTDRTGWNSWGLMKEYFPNLNNKGSDQQFLNERVYPCFAQHGSDSITQHYFMGMPNTFLSDYKTCDCPKTVGHESRCPNNVELDLPNELRLSNGVCGHIGAAGFYPPALTRFLAPYWNQFEDILEIESKHPEVFYWVKDGNI